MASAPAPTEPPPRRYHFTAAIGNTLFNYGGDLTNGKVELPSVINNFNIDERRWSITTSRGNHPPPNLNDGCCTSSHRDVYLYGGYDGTRYYDSLYKFQASGSLWMKLSSAGRTPCPIAKQRCGMVFCHESLFLFGGWGKRPTGPTQMGAEYVDYSVGDVLTNEIHCWDFSGAWSSPTITGRRPPPCYGFTLTMINEHKAVLFGGEGIGGQEYKHTYIFDFQIMDCSKLDEDRGGPWPEVRDAHAAVCLGFGGDHPHLLITGGFGDKKGREGAWTLDIKFWKWRKVKGLSLRRWGHSATGFIISQGIIEVVIFGGLDEQFNTLSSTIVLRFEYHECPSSDGPFGEWVLKDKGEGNQGLSRGSETK